MLYRAAAAIRREVGNILDPRAADFTAQRKIVGFKAREMAAARLAAELGGTSVPIPPAMEREGIQRLPALLTAQQVGEVRAFLADKPLADRYRRNGAFTADTIPAETHIAHYSTETVLDCPHVLQAATDPAILDMVEGCLGARPVISGLRLWWSSPSQGAEHVELFHRDVDDLRFVKLFIYLSDVGEGTGPHVYVPGSHCDERLTQIRRFTEEEVAEIGEPMTITGPAGTTFLANTYGIHRGLPPRDGPRLAFQALYTLRPTIY